MHKNTEKKKLYTPSLVYENIHLFHRLNPNTAWKIFDRMIFPILSYNSEVWGMYTKQEFKKWDNSAMEKNKSLTNPVTCGKVNPDIFEADDVVNTVQSLTEQ